MPITLLRVLTDIKSLTREELEAQFTAWEQPVYRVKQLMDWLYVHRETGWDAMTNLPKVLRDKLRQEYSLGTLELIRKQGARDTTQKFLWRLADHSLIESVLIPANPSLYGEPSDRHTLCVSTQVGCAYGCKFCASGLDGWKRNLFPHEIVEQVLGVERWSVEQAKVQSSKSDVAPVADAVEPATPTPRSQGNGFPGPRVVDNLVIMGMGEPLANYDNLLKALRLLNAGWGGRIGARKITVSTSGLAPQIRKLADEPEQFSLAVSLHGATDHVREKIMPVNRKFPLKELTAALDYYQSKRGRIITFEYILIAGVNDGLDQTKPLGALAKRLNAKVNLIPYNTSYTLATTTNGPTKFFRVEATPPASAVAATFKVTATVLPSKQVRLDWPSAPGHAYRIFGSTNLVDWFPFTDWIRTTSYAANLTLPPKTNGAPSLFRLEAQP